ncbi:hypothetical protein [Streptomyces sp. NPDC056987]|uniref:hypothetical protein n=1 Tax=Streptomyces sp. NPDC056987 TaxID=3345988 RepID=UPI00363A6318
MHTPTSCPTPDKGRCATQEAAQKAAQRMQFRVGRLLTPYPCACGWWHLASDSTQELPADAVADPADTDRLRKLEDAAFRDVVSAEARGQLDTPDRLALRHPKNLERWRRMLRELSDDLEAQLVHRSDANIPGIDDWRRRARRYGRALNERARECRALLARPRQDTATPVKTPAAQSRSAQNELRRLGGDKAIRRLIAAHGPEFAGYLAEEYAVLGADLPQHIEKYLPTEAEKAA